MTHGDSLGRKEMLSAVKRVLVDDEGQDLIEYALLAAFIALAAIVAITQLGTAVNNIYTRISSTLSTPSS
jgi:pilus assembly protein Flp/PilA